MKSNRNILLLIELFNCVHEEDIEICYKAEEILVRVLCTDESLVHYKNLNGRVKQDDCVLPSLFSFYIKHMLTITLEDEEGIRIGQKVNCNIFADDMAILIVAIKIGKKENMEFREFGRRNMGLRSVSKIKDMRINNTE